MQTGSDMDVAGSNMQKKDEWYRELVDTLPAMIFEMDTESRLTFVNQSAKKILGYADDDLRQKISVLEIIAPEDRNRAARNIKQMLNGEQLSEEYICWRKDGSRFPVIIRSTIIFHDRKPAGLRGIIVDITEHKQEEEQLLRMLSTAIEQSPTSVMVFDTEGKIVYVNPRFSLITGVQPDEAVGKPVFGLSFANVMPGQLSEVAKAIEIGHGWQGEIEYTKKNGKPCWVSAQIFPIKDDNGKITHFIDMEEDITERKIAEEELRKMFIALDQSPNSITIADWDGMITYVNPSFTRMTGIEPDDVIGKHKVDFTPKPTHQRIGSILETVKAGKEWKGERRYTKKEGGEYWVSIQISPLKDACGNVAQLLIIETDITERKQTENQLRELSAAVEQSPAGVKIIDEAGTIIYVNPKFLELSGYGYDEVLGNPTRKIPGVSIDNDSKIQLHNAIRTGKDWHGELQYKKRSGEIFWAESHVSAIKDEAGTIKSYVEITEDITERKLGEERLKSSLREKEVLLKEVHHRVKNNMQIISSLLNLQLSGIDQEPIRQILTESQNRIRSIALVHERMYKSDDLARIDFREYMKSLGSQLLQSYSSSSRYVNLIIEGDPIHLGVDQAVPCGLIMNELISNSLKHAFPGYREGTIKIHLLNGATNNIIVKDDGVGMPDDSCLSNAQSMGMQLVAALVEQLDGTITLDRSSGTQFTITFPVR